MNSRGKGRYIRRRGRWCTGDGGGAQARKPISNFMETIALKMREEEEQWGAQCLIVKF